MTDAEWLEQYFEKVAQSSDEGRQAVEYVKENNTPVRFKRARKSVGAFWTLNRRFYINSFHYSKERTLNDPRAWTLFVHEVRHLQQGPITAISVYGELDAWQYEFRLYKKITGVTTLVPALEELIGLPLNYDRKNLQRARKLMTKFAGIWYGAWILPLYPITKEIKYWLTRS
ncbi:MAG: hypothetical protein U0Z26_10275 [Anaerolineales bacterium]